MLRKFAAALLATTLIAGPALAAQPAAISGASPATQAAPAVKAADKNADKTADKNADKTVKTTKSAAHLVKHRKHVVRGKAGVMHQARHVKPANSHQASLAKTAKRS